jgi:hypothetical protein
MVDTRYYNTKNNEHIFDTWHYDTKYIGHICNTQHYNNQLNGMLSVALFNVILSVVAPFRMLGLSVLSLVDARLEPTSVHQVKTH